MDFIRWVMPEALPDMKDISFGKDVVARAAPVQGKLPLISSLGPSGYPVGQHASESPVRESPVRESPVRLSFCSPSQTLPRVPQVKC